MHESILFGIACIFLLGIGAQWLAWRLRFPAILLLLIAGFLAGPVTGIIDPDELLGDLLPPLVSLSVGIILFEGGLSLKFRELRQIAGVVRNLLSVGVIVTWAIAASAAYRVLDLDFGIAVLLGAILVVTGPTVIIPLLRHVRPSAQVGSILKWEGILVDPIGAVLAVLTFEVILQTELQPLARVAILGLLKTVVAGGLAGIVAAFVLLLFLRKFWIPDFLQNPASLMAVIAVFVGSNAIQAESGLLATTVMGLILANQKKVPVKHIVEFKENLRVLLISSLFVLLAARMQVRQFTEMGIESLAFLAALVVVGRPASVFFSTLGSELSWRERLFLSWMAPRGIVAAAVSSVFALRLSEAGYGEANILVPLTFFVVAGTVALYGLTAAPMARLLKISKADSQGVLMAGAHTWAREMARTLVDQGYEVLLVDTNRRNVYQCRMSGLSAMHANILADRFFSETELDGIRRLIALTPNDEVNSLACLKGRERFGRDQVYQLIHEEAKEEWKYGPPAADFGRYLFAPGVTYERLDVQFGEGAAIKRNRLTEEFGYEDFRKLYGEEAIPLFIIVDGELTVITADTQPNPKPGQTLISLVPAPRG
ncbi:MAG: hypothetical protein C4520_07775 [Candidatus Abyssobacteria bacterium SURF_5]|uniref:Uncharacterized protein n=1 Tax=Abyssobacteria bacterium (strain SURF_5) TaxID=2093360 RepID=A0A3A4NQL9_ABYX5|nr:MAG: hypothetical protein C4520_07775 [Candidatus Abyssubacteria bacterium SURF_5]